MESDLAAGVHLTEHRGRSKAEAAESAKKGVFFGRAPPSGSFFVVFRLRL